MSFFSKWYENFSPNFTCLLGLYVNIYARLQIFIQLSPTVTKLCHPPCISADVDISIIRCELGGRA